MEMELRAAGLQVPAMRPSVVKRMTSGEDSAQLKLIEKLLALNMRGSTSRREMRSLHSARGGDQRRIHSRKPTRQALTRAREPKRNLASPVQRLNVKLK